MKGWMRRVRGALGIAATWGAVFAVVLGGLAVVAGIFDPDSIDPGETIGRFAGIGMFFGAVSGLVFSTLLAVSENRKRLRRLSTGRAAMWGAVGTAAIPLLTGVADSMVILVCPIGAALAATSVAIARRGELDAAPEPPQLRD